jgi:hypothetical protein
VFVFSSGLETFTSPFSQNMATAGTTTKDGRAVVNSDFYSSGNSSKILQNGVLDAGSTDFFYFVNPNNTGFRIDANYVSGAAFSGRFTFADSSFDDLGLTPDKLGSRLIKS